jgi:hypothetical protein
LPALPYVSRGLPDVAGDGIADTHRNAMSCKLRGANA